MREPQRADVGTQYEGGAMTTTTRHGQRFAALSRGSLRLLAAIDAQILPGLRSGDPDCYETLVRTYAPYVLKTASAYALSDVEVAECFQKTFLRVMEHAAARHKPNRLLSTVLSISNGELCAKTLSTR